MATDVTYDLGQLDTFVKRLQSLERDAGDAALGIAEGLADLWIDTAKQRMGKDTWQLFNRTGVGSLSASPRGAHAEVIVEADTPYAGFHNYGNRYTPPNGFWNMGRDTAEQRARQLGGEIETQIRRVLTSGGVWNPRRLM